MNGFNLYAPISKIDREQRMVWGWASTEKKDLQKEVMKSAAVEAALPDYMEWKNIREMHRPSAVGVAKTAEMRDLGGNQGEGLWLGAHITDDTAWAKCIPDEDGDATYKGFSIGGEKLAKVGNEITEVRIVEISLVDRPANPECKIEVVKVASAPEDDVTHPEDITVEGDDTLAESYTVPAGMLTKLLSAMGIEKAAKRKDVSSKEGENKYGDVTFADPTNKKYPIDSEEHVRAAWSYINMPKNSSKYSSEDAAAIKGRIKSAASKFGIEIAEKAAEATDLKKSMYEVASMANLYEGLQGLKRSLKQESMWEGGDEADLECAAKCRDIANMIGELILAHTQHEMDEDADDEDDTAHAEQAESMGVMTMAAEAGNLKKRFGAVHKAAFSKASDHLDKAAAMHDKLGEHLEDMKEACAKVAKAAKDGGKDMGAMVDKAQEMHEQMGDHLDVAQSHMEKGMGGWGESETDDTHEGAEAKAEKLAKAATAVAVEYEDEDSAVVAALASNPKALAKYLSTMKATAKSEATATELANTPAGLPKAHRFVVHAVAKGAGDIDPSGGKTGETNIMDGIEKDDPNAMGKVFAKMLTLPGKPGMGRQALDDPQFHGSGGR